MNSMAEVSGDAAWFKSSYSNDQGGECVEGARLGGGVMAVRDSKQPDGPAFAFRADVWSAFVTSLKGGGEGHA
ncbi:MULTISPECIES: DUF397 domain-containing protein [unclassified Streptomyces]|uniref:DUF397 domain-containing protein n=1 Tax=unclassified Streptomyces TaxID=2593676 RepID=UPI002DD96858|nr:MULTISPECIES: DUF397 domain-containing protein [unclassified Streptomyces]WSA93316.1 DUF397 domain-containing protein [Streptomyces sp. NBC_01795]WSB77704.1 DUF397 domain-containing protein [Streptomyces sp. NBC_01775]WSS14047.1 DUF397 domain-containing protein [Streptomyces sp. NBC_01186]WSS42866.1 DUF397 domain-containing protein [Streptomyces sp. NBC_01187]